MSNWSYINMQDATSPLMEQLMFFHDHTLIILIIITSIVTYVMTVIMFNNIVNRLLLEGQLIEFFWTLLPALTLIFIAFPSLRLLYLLDEINKPLLTLKITLCNMIFYVSVVLGVPKAFFCADSSSAIRFFLSRTVFLQIKWTHLLFTRKFDKGKFYCGGGISWPHLLHPAGC